MLEKTLQDILTVWVHPCYSYRVHQTIIETSTEKGKEKSPTRLKTYLTKKGYIQEAWALTICHLNLNLKVVQLQMRNIFTLIQDIRNKGLSKITIVEF